MAINIQKETMRKNLIYWIICLYVVLGIPSAYADVVWPGLYIVGGALSPLVIVTGLITETLFVKYFTTMSWQKSGIITFIMNLITAVIGIALIPLSGLLVEGLLDITIDPYHRFGIGSFHWSLWLIDYIVIILCNTLIEGLFLKLAVKLHFKKIFWWLFGANTLSVAYCALYLILTPRQQL